MTAQQLLQCALDHILCSFIDLLGFFHDLMAGHIHMLITGKEEKNSRQKKKFQPMKKGKVISHKIINEAIFRQDKYYLIRLVIKTCTILTGKRIWTPCFNEVKKFS
jgi:hypothetical protein